MVRLEVTGPELEVAAVGVLEIARLRSVSGHGDDLERRIREAVGLLAGDGETRKVEVYRGVEDPDEMTLLVTWTSVGAHEAWRASPARQRWRELVGPGLAGPAKTDHHRLVVAPKGT